jgi:threonine synthase
LAAKHQITPYVFYPTGLGSAKVVASMVCGATVIEVDGTYDEVNSACRKVGQQTGIPFVNISLRPFYSEGAKTFVYEILEQLDWHAPDHIIIPVAGTTLITKVVKGLREMRELKLIEHSDSRVHAAQAQGCAPVVAALDDGNDRIHPHIPRTIATSIAIGNPGDAPIALKAIRETGGVGASATDEEIIAAIRLIANTEGIFAEPAGGAAIVAAQKLRAVGAISEHDTVVIAITGTGLKTPEIGKLLWQNHAHTPCDVGQMIDALESAATSSSPLPARKNAGIGEAQHQRSSLDYYG